MRARHLVVVLSTLCPVALHAEGAAILFDCQMARLCDAAGECAPEAGAVSFLRLPLDIGADGSGRYSLAYRDVTAEIWSASPVGPMIWIDNADALHSLRMTGPQTALWVVQEAGPAPGAEIRFLTCAVQG